MERVSILSAVLLTAVTTMGDQQPYNLYKVSLTQKGYIQASSRYSASTDKVECDRHFLAPGRNCYNTGKLILLVHGARYFTRNGKILKCLAVSHAVPARSRGVTVAFNFINERNV
jgi:hypothetical protein